MTLVAAPEIGPTRLEVVEFLLRDLRSTGWGLFLAADISTDRWEEIEAQIISLLIERGITSQEITA